MRNEENYKKFILEVLELSDIEKNRRDTILLTEDDFITIDNILNSLGCTEVSKRNLGEVLKLRYGLGNDGVIMTLKESGKKIGFSANAARMLQYQALNKLRKFESYKLKKFLISNIREEYNDVNAAYEKYAKENYELKTILEKLEIELENKNRIIEEKDKIIKFLKNLANDAEEIVKASSKLNTSIDDLDISVRTYNGLIINNIRTLKDIVKKSKNELLKTRNFGRRSMNELEKILEENGLKFGMKFIDYLE